MPGIAWTTLLAQQKHLEPACSNRLLGNVPEHRLELSNCLVVTPHGLLTPSKPLRRHRQQTRSPHVFSEKQLLAATLPSDVTYMVSEPHSDYLQRAQSQKPRPLGAQHPGILLVHTPHAELSAHVSLP